MKEQEIYSIDHFKKGDIVTQVIPAEAASDQGPYLDTQYMGSRLIFLGIANGCIYFERSSTIEKLIAGQTFFVPLCFYENVWNYYEEPKFLEGKGNVLSMIEKAMSGQEEKALEKAHERALNEDNFELAAKISRKLKKLRAKKSSENKFDPDNPEDIFRAGGLGGLFTGGFDLDDDDLDDD